MIISKQQAIREQWKESCSNRLCKKRKWLVTNTCSCKVFTKDLKYGNTFAAWILIRVDGSSMQWFDKKCFQSVHLNAHTTKLCSKKNWGEPSALNCWNPVCPALWFLWKSKDFLVAREQKLGTTGHWALLEHSLDIVTCRTLLRRDLLWFHSCKQPL